jgi:hypothetical protein
MTVPEVMFTTWVGWPLYLGFGILIFTGVWEYYTKK